MYRIRARDGAPAVAEHTEDIEGWPDGELDLDAWLELDDVLSGDDPPNALPTGDDPWDEWLDGWPDQGREVGVDSV